MRIKDIAATRVRYGYRRIHVLLRREGWKINHKRVYRLYRTEGLNLRSKSKRKKVSAPRVPEKNMASAVSECWAMDFVSDQLYNGKRFRALTLIDTYSRECIAIHADKAIKGETVVEVLEGVKESRGLPKKIKVDNGPSSFRGPWMPGLTLIRCNWNTRAPGSRLIIPTSSRSTAASGTSA